MRPVAIEGPPNRFERRRAENHARLLGAAIELFRERGIQKTTVLEICERANVARRTFFNHFESREHLLRALAQSRAEGLDRLIRSRAESGAGVPEVLRELFERIAAQLESTGPLYRELVAEMMHVTHGTRGDESTQPGVLHQAFLDLVVDGVERGNVAPNHPPEVLADVIVGTLNAVLANWTSIPAYDLRAGLRGTGRALADLLTAEPAPP